MRSRRLLVAHYCRVPEAAVEVTRELGWELADGEQGRHVMSDARYSVGGCQMPGNYAPGNEQEEIGHQQTRLSTARSINLLV